MLLPTRRRIALTTAGALAVLVVALLATDALARRGVVKPTYVLASLRDLVAGLTSRVEAIEVSDCGCPGVLEPVCANGTTWQNQCEATCAIGRLPDPPAFIQFSEGPCDNANPTCGGFACTEGHVCIDGACSRGRCEGFAERQDCRGVGCQRGYRCATYPETGCIASFCHCDPVTGGTLCTTDCNGSVCVPEDGFPRASLPPPGSPEVPLTR